MDIKPTQTLVYKTVGSLEIPLDVYLSQESKSPILLWFHGGGLLQGRRDQLAPYLRRGVREHGYTCISADYRLAPQASVAEILEDVKDCIAFIRTQLNGKLGGANAVDPERLVVAGSSAGGYLALLAGLYCDPKPKAIVPIYPITDPLGVFFTNPQPVPMKRYLASRKELGVLLDSTGEAVANCNPLPNMRMNMYVRMLVDANLAKLWHVPDGDEGELFRLSRQVYKYGLPPAYFVHGDADSCVGVEQADEVVGAMLGCGQLVKYERPHGQDHFLDTGAEYDNAGMMKFLSEAFK